MKIYTKTGDDGTTGILGRGRVPKDDLRIAAYGTVDELNALLGVARAVGLDAAADTTGRPAPERALPRGLSSRRSFPRRPVSQHHHPGTRRASRTDHRCARGRAQAAHAIHSCRGARRRPPSSTWHAPSAAAPSAWSSSSRTSPARPSLPACSFTSIGSVTCCSCWPVPSTSARRCR